MIEVLVIVHVQHRFKSECTQAVVNNRVAPHQDVVEVPEATMLNNIAVPQPESKNAMKSGFSSSALKASWNPS